jgi:hypothetical protein
MFLRKNTTYLFPMSKHISELISNFSVFFLAFSVYPDMSTEVRLFCACLRSIPLEGLRLPLLAPTQRELQNLGGATGSHGFIQQNGD